MSAIDEWAATHNDRNPTPQVLVSWPMDATAYIENPDHPTLRIVRLNLGGIAFRMPSGDVLPFLRMAIEVAEHALGGDANPQATGGDA